jgi:uncharacterized protein involved in exopolysaccharide biosynthesis
MATAGPSNEAESKLLSLKLSEKDLLSRFTESYPPVQSIREQIRITREFLENSNKKKAKLQDPLQQDIYKQLVQNQTDLIAAKSRTADFVQQLSDLENKISSFQGLEAKNRDLLRDVTKNDENYRLYRQRLEESRIHEDLNRQKMTSVSVIEPAFEPVFPVKAPQPLPLLILGALAAGIFGSVGIMMLAKKFDKTISTPSEAEKYFDVPVLVAISIK